MPAKLDAPKRWYFPSELTLSEWEKGLPDVPEYTVRGLAQARINALITALKKERERNNANASKT